jgi:hypothetical protein
MINSEGGGTGQVCVFCHHPHRGDNSGGDTNGGDDLHWNKGYFSDTSNDTYVDTPSLMQAPVGTINATVPQSYLCMACHDGTVAAGSLIASPGDAPGGNIAADYTAVPGVGTTMVDDHPVNMVYTSGGTNVDIVANTGDSILSGKYILFDGYMQCSTCHDVHMGDNSASTIVPVQFMRGEVSGSAICIDCHTSK